MTKKKVYPEPRRRVFVAMSGGVDSSVAAALLKRSGKFDVTGVFCLGWQPAFAEASAGKPEGMIPPADEAGCGWGNERRDAIRAAAKIGIPFLTFDFSEEYGEKVVEYMKKEYEKGRTPNPDVMCNKYIKFGLFLEKSLAMGADMIATGHYVKISNPCLAGRRVKSQISKLMIARDKNKDQSYFLWTLAQGQLKHCLFPIGDYTKPEVRKMARKFGLPVAGKKDSQGLCFVGNINFADFLRKIIPKKEGEIATPDGKVIGKHDGAHFYTIGQRHGLKIPGGPYFVVGKNLKTNILIVAKEKEETKFHRKEAVVGDVNWINGNPPDFSKKYLGRIRYRQPLQELRITKNEERRNKKTLIHNSKFIIRFKKPQRAVTPGQSLVLYDGEVMLGGGIIED